MPKGLNPGGRPADPNALRRNRPDDAMGWRTLPAEGRSGRPPTWPLSRQTKREATIWTREWARPQAIVWEERGQVEEVALYVRNFVAAEKPAASVASRSLVARHMDALGISGAGLRFNRWTIGQPPQAHRPTGTTGQPSQAHRASRARLEVVEGGNAS
jgi:hypothetical protein